MPIQGPDGKTYEVSPAKTLGWAASALATVGAFLGYNSLKEESLPARPETTRTAPLDPASASDGRTVESVIANTSEADVGGDEISLRRVEANNDSASVASEAASEVEEAPVIHESIAEISIEGDAGLDVVNAPQTFERPAVSESTIALPERILLAAEKENIFDLQHVKIQGGQYVYCTDGPNASCVPLGPVAERQPPPEEATEESTALVPEGAIEELPTLDAASVQNPEEASVTVAVSEGPGSAPPMPPQNLEPSAASEEVVLAEPPAPKVAATEPAQEPVTNPTPVIDTVQSQDVLSAKEAPPVVAPSPVEAPPSKMSNELQLTNGKYGPFVNGTTLLIQSGMKAEVKTFLFAKDVIGQGVLLGDTLVGQVDRVQKSEQLTFQFAQNVKGTVRVTSPETAQSELAEVKKVAKEEAQQAHRLAALKLVKMVGKGVAEINVPKEKLPGEDLHKLAIELLIEENPDKTIVLIKTAPIPCPPCRKYEKELHGLSASEDSLGEGVLMIKSIYPSFERAEDHYGSKSVPHTYLIESGDARYAEEGKVGVFGVRGKLLPGFMKQSGLVEAVKKLIDRE